MEAYLGDTLLRAVLADKAAMDRLMQADTDLLQEKYTLAEIAADLVSDKPTLFKAVMLRHDCVHRNGLDASGRKLKVFTNGVCGKHIERDQ